MLIQQSLLSELLAFDSEGPSPTQLRIVSEQLPITGRTIRGNSNLSAVLSPAMNHIRPHEPVTGPSRPRPASPGVKPTKLSDRDIIKLINGRPSLTEQIQDLHRSEKQSHKRKASEKKIDRGHRPT